MSKGRDHAISAKRRHIHRAMRRNVRKPGYLRHGGVAVETGMAEIQPETGQGSTIAPETGKDTNRPGFIDGLRRRLKGPGIAPNERKRRFLGLFSRRAS